MSSESPSGRVASAVYLGAAILIGLPVAFLLSTAFSQVLEAFGWEWVLEHPVGLVVPVASLLLGLQVATEVTAVRLYGLEAVGRGTPRVALVRYVLFAASAVVALVAATWIGISTAFGGYGLAPALLGGLVVLAGLVALYRTSSSFVAGFRSEDEHADVRT